jgi:Tfp pilus assembly protein PilO
MRKIKLLPIISVSTTLLAIVSTYQVSELTKELETSSIYIKELETAGKESRAQVLELEAKVKEMEEVVDKQKEVVNKQYEKIIKLQEEIDAKQGLEDLLVDIIMTEGYPKPTKEFARELSKLVISISKEYEETYGFENDIAKLMSIIRVESEFNPNCKSSAGAKGLMQLMDDTGQAYAKKLGFKEYKPYDPEQNIRVAWYYYNINKEKMGEDKAIVAYNQGYRNLTKAVRVSRGNPRSYLNKIKTHHNRYSIKLEEVLP